MKKYTVTEDKVLIESTAKELRRRYIFRHRQDVKVKLIPIITPLKSKANSRKSKNNYKK